MNAAQNYPKHYFNQIYLTPLCSHKWDLTMTTRMNLGVMTLFVLCPTTGQVWYQVLFKVGLDAGPQPTCVRQNPKIPSAPSAFPPMRAPQTPGNNWWSNDLILFRTPDWELHHHMHFSITPIGFTGYWTHILLGMSLDLTNHIYQPRVGYDTRSIFKQSLTGLNSEFSFS